MLCTNSSVQAVSLKAGQGKNPVRLREKDAKSHTSIFCWRNVSKWTLCTKISIRRNEETLRLSFSMEDHHADPNDEGSKTVKGAKKPGEKTGGNHFYELEEVRRSDLERSISRRSDKTSRITWPH